MASRGVGNQPPVSSLDAARIARLRRRALEWYAEQKRDLPWRRDRDPYRIWISEILLQQTRVEAARPYFERFVERFPTVHDLAAADVDEVLRLWSGLGYYRRARNLHAAAQSVVRDHDGELPGTDAGLRSLPGIGAYTAGAIRSIAFGERAPAVDGNVIRVLARLQAYRGDPTRGAGTRAIHEWATALVPEEDPGAWNQSLMEIGAQVCIPKAPRCFICPFFRLCAARRQGVAASIPPAKRTPSRRTREVAAVVRRNGGLLLARRPEGGRMGGLWELPGGEVARGETAETALRRIGRESIGAELLVGERLAAIRHAILDRQIRGEAHSCRLGRGRLAPRGYEDLRWARPPDLDGLPLTGATRKYLRTIVPAPAAPQWGASPLQRPSGRAAGRPAAPRAGRG